MASSLSGRLGWRSGPRRFIFLFDCSFARSRLWRGLGRKSIMTRPAEIRQQLDPGGEALLVPSHDADHKVPAHLQIPNEPSSVEMARIKARITFDT